MRARMDDWMSRYILLNITMAVNGRRSNSVKKSVLVLVDAMRSIRWCAPAALASIFVFNQATFAAQDLPTPGPGPAAPPAEACASFEEFVATACPLTWHGITLYGAYDVGVGWVSHGLPENGYNYEGESLGNRNGNHPQYLIAPPNLSQTGLGITGTQEI